jgi:hypothetical protein
MGRALAGIQLGRVIAHLAGSSFRKTVGDEGRRKPRWEVFELRRLFLFLVALLTVWLLALGGAAFAAGPSGSSECALADDDCDGLVDEDTGGPSDDSDGDGLIDEDPAGDANGDGNPDDDFDGAVDEDVPDDDGDGAVNEDGPGDAADDPGENQVDCNEAASQNVGGVYYLYAGSNGVEACADDGSQLPVDGRATATTDQGGYAAIDGDNSNPGTSNGYARLDQSGIHCGNTMNQDSTADQSANTSADCG